MNPLEKLIKELTKLPGIGEKTANRLAYNISKRDKNDALGLAFAIFDVKEKIVFCKKCCNLSESDVCKLCSDPKRDKHSICVVEEPQDAAAIERSGAFNGTYHILHGRVSPLDGVGPDQLKIKELLARIKGDANIKELVIATNPTTEGEATALYISNLTKGMDIKITRIAFGIPFGGDIEYIDRSTLARSIEFRSAFKS